MPFPGLYLVRPPTGLSNRQRIMSEIKTILSHTAAAGRKFESNESVLKAPPRFLNILPIAIYACDADGRLCWYNHRAAEMWGRQPNVGDDSQRFGGAYKLFRLDGSRLAPDETPMAEVLQTGIPAHDREVIIERPDGMRIIASAHIDPIEDATGKVIGAINCFQDVTHYKQAEKDLRDRERWFRELLENLPAAVYTTDAEGRITFFNAAAEAFWGARPVIGQSEWCGSWRMYRPNGEPLPHDECPMAIALKEQREIRGEEAVAERPDGTRVPFMAYPTPLRDSNGTMVGAVNMLVDISERKQAEERQKVLIDELNHRVKNTLATVQSLASQTFRGAGLPGDVCKIFDGRLFALSKAHTLLTFSGWKSADFRTLIEDVLEPYRNSNDNRIHLTGNSVWVTPKVAPLFAMVFHELATNAAKYGALSTDQGTVHINWAVVGGETGDMLQAEWQESGGPEVRPPKRRGFGSRLIERGIAAELKGQAVILYESDGVRCRFEIPLSNATR